MLQRKTHDILHFPELPHPGWPQHLPSDRLPFLSSFFVPSTRSQLVLSVFLVRQRMTHAQPADPTRSIFTPLCILFFHLPLSFSLLSRSILRDTPLPGISVTSDVDERTRRELLSWFMVFPSVYQDKAQEK